MGGRYAKQLQLATAFFVLCVRAKRLDTASRVPEGGFRFTFLPEMPYLSIQSGRHLSLLNHIPCANESLPNTSLSQNNAEPWGTDAKGVD